MVRCRAGGLILAGLLVMACSETTSVSSDPAVARGRTVYLNNCIACHNVDPSRDGAVGPANAGASLALLEAKLLRGEYPPGYTPKRSTGAMPLFEQLRDQIPDLAAFLEDAAR